MMTRETEDRLQRRIVNLLRNRMVHDVDFAPPRNAPGDWLDMLEERVIRLRVVDDPFPVLIETGALVVAWLQAIIREQVEAQERDVT